MTYQALRLLPDMDIQVFEKRITDFTGKHELFGRNDKLLLAVSGGADSVALLHILNGCYQSGRLDYAPHCVHFNHLLRDDESDQDADFVRSQVVSLGLACQCQPIHVRDYARQHQVSIESAGREMRLRELASLAQAKQCTAIATGHHQDDNAETVIQRLARGTGLRGLAGIRPKRILNGSNFVSPLLCVGRDEIRAYLRARRLPWRDDTSNTDCSFRRNFIRHQLLPALQSASTTPLAERLAQLSAEARRLNGQLRKRATILTPGLIARGNDYITLERAGFLNEPVPVQVELIRRILVELGCGERNLSAGHYQRVIQLACSKASGNRVQLPEGCVARAQYDQVEFTTRAGVGMSETQTPEPSELTAPGLTRCGPYTIEATLSAPEAALPGPFKQGDYSLTEHLDWDQIRLPISIRPRQPGDRFCPLGKQTPQKVGRFLINAKVPASVRERVMVLADACKLIWVCPVRLSNEVKITPKTKRVLRLQIRSDPRR